jgi:nucleoside phosphorylase
MAHTFQQMLTHADYTVACICPRGMELAPVEGMLDEIHESFPTSRDQNAYKLGKIGGHNVVVTVLPETGNSAAATVATQLLNDFPAIRFGVLVGIGGGIPGDEGEDDVRLGDVVVGQPTATFGGVVHYDLGKILVDGSFKRTGLLNKPPSVLSANVRRLQAQHSLVGSQISRYLSEMVQRCPRMQSQYSFPAAHHDQLFLTSYVHQSGLTCDSCDKQQTISRPARPYHEPRIHYGTIGSANVVVKNPVVRDELKRDMSILCVETEAAGLMDNFPCLVIRGICDYADSHKNKRWQPYAAAVASAYMKELLMVIPVTQVVQTQNVQESLDQIETKIDLDKLPCVRGAMFDSYEAVHVACHPDTRVDLLRQILDRARQPHSKSIFWLNGMAGTGKSTISWTVAEWLTNQCSFPHISLGASFFFRRGEGDRGSASRFFPTIAHQLLSKISGLNPLIAKVINSDP